MAVRSDQHVHDHAHQGRSLRRKPQQRAGRKPAGRDCWNIEARIAVVAVSIAGGSRNNRVSPDAAGKEASAKAPGDRISFNVVPSVAVRLFAERTQGSHIHARARAGDDARMNEART